MADVSSLADLLKDAGPARVQRGDLEVQSMDPLRLVQALRACKTIDADLIKAPHKAIKTIRMCDCSKLR